MTFQGECANSLTVINEELCLKANYFYSVRNMRATSVKLLIILLIELMHKHVEKTPKHDSKESLLSCLGLVKRRTSTLLAVS